MRTRSQNRARRSGGVAAVVVDLVFLVLVNVWPGWDVVPFLTPDFAEVLPWANACLVVGALAGVAVAITGSSIVKAIGDGAGALVGLGSLLATWRVFPFDLGGGWEFVFRAVIVVAALACVAAVIGVVVTLAQAIQRAGHGSGAV